MEFCSMGAPKEVIDLIERFERNIESYKGQGYNEAQVRKEFIDPCGTVTVNYGANQDFNATPAAGYEVNEWKVDGGVVDGNSNTYTLTNITANHTIAVTFKKMTFNLTVTLITNDACNLPSDAKWYLGSDPTLRNSGDTVVLDAGNYNVTIKCTDSSDPYIKPDDKTININGLREKTETRTYLAAGYIIYNCYYYNNYGNRSELGVGWKVGGESSYHNGQRKYVASTYTVQFESLAEHATPANTQVIVTKGSTNSGQDKQYQRVVFYVDTLNGNNNNKGGSSNKFLTIQKGLNSAPSITSDIYVDSGGNNIYESLSFPLKTIYLHGQGVYLYGWHSCCPSTNPSGMVFIGLYLRCQ
jgi:hypothetical protein